MTRFLTFAVLTLLPLLAWGEGYICITDKSTGFVYENGEWRNARMRADRKFIVRRPTDAEQWLISVAGKSNAKWVVGEIGDQTPSIACPNDFDSEGRLYCAGFNFSESIPDDFRMNKNSLRFLHGYLWGYWSGGKDGEDTPQIAIGKCSPM